MDPKFKMQVEEVLSEMKLLIKNINHQLSQGHKKSEDINLFNLYSEAGEQELRLCKVKLETILEDLKTGKFSYYEPCLGQMISDHWFGEDACKLGGKIMSIEDKYMKLRNCISGRYTVG